MSEALQSDKLSPEALEFVKAGTPKPASQSVSAPLGDVGAAAVAAAAPQEQAAAAPEPPIRVLKKPAREKQAAPPPVAAAPSGMVSVSFRLPAEIPMALVQASADRKVKRLRPYSQQEIVAEALSLWLKQQGFLA